MPNAHIGLAIVGKYRIWMSAKAKEFTEKGSEIYQGNVPDGAKAHH